MQLVIRKEGMSNVGMVEDLKMHYLKVKLLYYLMYLSELIRKLEVV